jgi:hypothetical protein
VTHRICRRDDGWHVVRSDGVSLLGAADVEKAWRFVASLCDEVESIACLLRRCKRVDLDPGDLLRVTYAIRDYLNDQGKMTRAMVEGLTAELAKKATPPLDDEESFSLLLLVGALCKAWCPVEYKGPTRFHRV